MSTPYKISLSIGDLKRGDATKIKKIIGPLFNWKKITATPDCIFAYGQDSVSTGYDEELANKIKDEVWKKLGRYVPISMTEYYEFDEETYNDE